MFVATETLTRRAAARRPLPEGEEFSLLFAFGSSAACKFHIALEPGQIRFQALCFSEFRDRIVEFSQFIVDGTQGIVSFGIVRIVSQGRFEFVDTLGTLSHAG